HAAGRRPDSSSRIIYLRTAKATVTIVVPSRHQHLAGAQQRRRVTRAWHKHAPGRRPDSSRRIIQLRTAKDTVSIVVSSRHQHLAGTQKRRRVTTARNAEIAGGTPTGIAGWLLLVLRPGDRIISRDRSAHRAKGQNEAGCAKNKTY